MKAQTSPGLGSQGLARATRSQEANASAGRDRMFAFIFSSLHLETLFFSLIFYVCVRAQACTSARSCVRRRILVCVHACVRVGTCVWVRLRLCARACLCACARRLQWRGWRYAIIPPPLHPTPTLNFGLFLLLFCACCYSKGAAVTDT